MNKKLLAVLFSAGLVLTACGGGDDEASKDSSNSGSNSGTETASADPEKITQQKCITCHGNNLEGQGNFPALNDVGSRYSEEEILEIILNGKGAMPPGIIKGGDAEAVAAWLAEKK